MKAAIYARKSTDDSNRNEDNRSTTRQVERARAYTLKKGWTVDDDHVFVDDGISGAEFKNRPALLRLLNRLKEFDVIVMSELSRLGREQSQTGSVLADMYSKGVRVVFYLTDEELRFESAVDKFMVSAVSFAAELEREKASQRSRDALERKAQRGYNTGGVVYGYDNVQVTSKNGDGEVVRSHTEYRINEKQAEVVRAIFRAYADGHGVKIIAKAMNGDPQYKDVARQYFGGRRPAPPRKGTGSWAPTSLRGILHNARYTGAVPFGLHRKVYAGGTKKRVKQDTHLLVKNGKLEIVPPDLWRAVQKRLKNVRDMYVRENDGRLWGRPETSRYLLSGLMRCEECSGSMIVLSNPIPGPVLPGSNSKRRLAPHYICNYHHNRGSTVCENKMRVPLAEVDTLLIDALDEQVLKSEVIHGVVKNAVQGIRARLREAPDLPRRLEAEIAKLRRELDRFVALIAAGRAPDTVLKEIKTREQRIKELETELASYSAPDLSELDWRRVEKDLRGRLAQFTELLHANIPQARQVLRKLLVGPVRFIPRGGNDYLLRGKTCVDPLFLPRSMEMASPMGLVTGPNPVAAPSCLKS